MQATSSVAGLQGFWLGGDFVNYGDGAEAASAAPDQIPDIPADPARSDDS